MPAESNLPYWRQFLFLGLGMVCYTICRSGFPVGLAAMGKEFQWTAFEASVLATIFLLGQAQGESRPQVSAAAVAAERT